MYLSLDLKNPAPENVIYIKKYYAFTPETLLINTDISFGTVFGPRLIFISFNKKKKVHVKNSGILLYEYLNNKILYHFILYCFYCLKNSKTEILRTPVLSGNM